MPHGGLYALERAGTGALYAHVSGLRNALLDNALRILGPDSRIAARRWLARGVLASFSRFALETLGTRSIPPVRVLGAEHFERARAAGRGILAVSLHMGNYEAGAALLGQLVQPLAIAYQRDPSPAFESARSRLRAVSGVEEIALDGAPWSGIRIRSVLRRGGVVLLAGDYGYAPRPDDGFRLVSFFGEPAPFPLWPARLAVASTAPLLPSFVVREPSGGYRLEIERAIWPGPDREGGPEALLGELVRVFESRVRRHPDQWLVIHRYWATPRGRDSRSGVSCP